MLEVLETKKDLIGFKKVSRNFRSNHSVESRLCQPKQLYENLRVDKMPR